MVLSLLVQTLTAGGQVLEQDGKPPDVNEILLMEDSGAVMEGMTSNLFVLSLGTVLTAGEGVLIGTVRNLVLKVKPLLHYVI